MKFKRKSEIRQTVDFLIEMEVDQEIIDDFITSTNDPDQVEESVTQILINCLSKLDTEDLKRVISAYSDKFCSNDDPDLEKAKNVMIMLHIAERLKEARNKVAILRQLDFVAIEERMMLDGILNVHMHYRKSKQNSNKYLLIGIIHHLIDLGYFEIDENNPKKSISRIIENLKERWEVDNMNEFYRKKNKEKYKALATRTFPLIEILELRRNGKCLHHLVNRTPKI